MYRLTERGRQLTAAVLTGVAAVAGESPNRGWCLL